MTRKWPRKEIGGAIQAQLESAQAKIVDVGYGGLKLAFENQRDLPSVFDVTLPTAGITVTAQRIWAHQSMTTDEFLCGVRVEIDPTLASPWREFVDSVSAGGGLS